MKVLTKDHKYELDNFEGLGVQIIQFIEKVKGVDDELITVNDGTTNEEVLKMLINRLNGLNTKFPSTESGRAINNLTKALMWLNRRTENRTKRGVEGKHLA